MSIVSVVKFDGEGSVEEIRGQKSQFAGRYLVLEHTNPTVPGMVKTLYSAVSKFTKGVPKADPADVMMKSGLDPAETASYLASVGQGAAKKLLLLIQDKGERGNRKLYESVQGYVNSVAGKDFAHRLVTETELANDSDLKAIFDELPSDADPEDEEAGEGTEE